MLACLLASPAWAQRAHTNGPPTHPSIARQSAKQSSATQPKPDRVLDTQETKCITNMLRARSLAEAKTLRGKCADSFTRRALYASVLVKLHAPHADREVINNLPTNDAQMDELFAFGDAWSPNYPISLLQGQAYERYYHAIFRIVAARPGLLPRFFAIADQFGTNDPNVDEEVWFCEELKKLYEAMPKEYMRAARAETNPDYKSEALGCRTGSGA